MTNNCNIYDIDGEIIRNAFDTKELSIDDAQKRINEYKEKLNTILKENPKDHKIGVYKDYIKNLQSYVMNQYILHPELIPHVEMTTAEQIQDAMKELEDSLESDEYVPFEEIKD